MKRILIRVLVWMILAAAAGRGFAQSYVTFRDEWDAVQKNRLAFGPFRLFPSLSLQNVGYDDNVYFETKPEADYTATIVPRVKAVWPLREWLLLSVQDAPEYAFYLHEKNRREFANSTGAGFKALLFNRFVVSGDYEFERHRRALSSELGATVTDTTSGYNIGLGYETARKTSLSAAAFDRTITYEDFQPGGAGMSLSQSLDRRERGASAEFDYQVFYEGFFFLSAQYTDYSFSDPSSSGRDATAAQVDGGFRFPLTASIRGTLALGYKTFKPKSGAYGSFSGLTGNTSLEGRFGRLGFRLLYRRDTPFSFYDNVLYFVENDYGGGVSLYLTGFLRIDYNYDRGQSDYPDPAVAGPGGMIHRKDTHQSHSVGVVFRLFRTTGFGLTWNSLDWTSTLPGWDRKRQFIGVFLTQSF